MYILTIFRVDRMIIMFFSCFRWTKVRYNEVFLFLFLHIRTNKAGNYIGEKKKRKIMDVPSGIIVGCRLVRRFSGYSIFLVTQKKRRRRKNEEKKYNSAINPCTEWSQKCICVSGTEDVVFFFKYICHKRRLILFFFKE